MATGPVHALAGKPAPDSLLVNLPKLVAAYHLEQPDPSAAAEQVSFGTSGHRGSSLQRTFNEAHVLAITQAICRYRRHHGICGPLYLGWDTHALSEPARVSAIEVLVANGVDVRVDIREDATPTPVISHAIVAHNRGRTTALADGIVITPSHNPPEYGGVKYDPPSGGPAAAGVTGWIQTEANDLLLDGLRGVRRIPWGRAGRAAAVHPFDYRDTYVRDLRNVIDLDIVRGSAVRVGIDPLGGASLRYWEAIAEEYGVQLSVVNRALDATFRFVRVDHDGVIRMDPSSPSAMAGLIERRDQFDLAVANDPDADRYGIVSRRAGLLDPNHVLALGAWYLIQNRRQWTRRTAIGKTAVTSGIVDRVAARLGRSCVEMPVGFKYFVDGLSDGSLGMAGEESAGASFLRRDGTTWTTDKDGLIMALLAAEMTAEAGCDLADQYAALVSMVGESFYARVDRPATGEQKSSLARLSRADIDATVVGGAEITAVQTAARGNHQPLGGIKVTTLEGWFAARPSGTEPVYKLYAESFKDAEHLQRILDDAEAVVAAALATEQRR